MKTKLDTLENLHDVVLEDLVRAEVKIRNLDELEDNDTVEGFKKKGLYGDFTEATKKDVVEQEQLEIKRLRQVLATVDKLIIEERKWQKRTIQNITR